MPLTQEEKDRIREEVKEKAKEGAPVETQPRRVTVKPK